MGSELVGLIENHEIPCGGEELLLDFFVPGHLVESDDEVVEILEGIACRCRCFKCGRKNIKLKSELLE
jgi:hypothetical protein